MIDFNANTIIDNYLVKDIRAIPPTVEPRSSISPRASGSPHPILHLLTHRLSPMEISDEIEPAKVKTLHAAILTRSLNVVKNFIKDHRPFDYINSLDENGKTPLHVAVANNCGDITDFLIANGALINILSAGGGITPLHVAALLDYEGLIEKLLKAKAYILVLSSDNEIPLQIAARRNCLKAATSLIKYYQLKQIDLNVSMQSYFAPLQLAVMHGHLEMVQLLINNGANPQILTLNGDSLLTIAKKHDYQPIIEYLQFPPVKRFIGRSIRSR